MSRCVPRDYLLLVEWGILGEGRRKVVPAEQIKTHDRLTVISEGPHRGTTWVLPAGTVLLGRADEADLRLDEPTVSRRHATLERAGNRTIITDLDSTSGTTVNGQPVRGSVELHDGDEIGVASVLLRLGAPAEATSVMPQVAPPKQASYAVDHQAAHQLNNVGGDQYNHYLQTVHAQRDGFLREVAATRTRARILIWTGLLLFIVGIGAFAAMAIQFISDVPTAGSDPKTAQDAFENMWGRELGGVPIGFIGWAVGLVGLLMMAIGLVLHVIATSRRRRVERDFTPVPPAGFHPGHPRS